MVKRSKYGAVKTTFLGIKFDSKLEARRYHELLTLQKIGVISDLKVHEPFTVIPSQPPHERATKYVADFTYREHGELIVEDTKSAATAKNKDYIMKRKLMLLVHKIKVKEVYA